MSGKYDHMDSDTLKKHFLQHRDDQEAFYAYMDKLNASGRAIVIDPTNPESERQANEQIQSKVELLQRCKSAIGFDGITLCGEAPLEAPKPWQIQHRGQHMYFTAEELKAYLEGLTIDKTD